MLPEGRTVEETAMHPRLQHEQLGAVIIGRIGYDFVRSGLRQRHGARGNTVVTSSNYIRGIRLTGEVSRRKYVG